MSSVQVPTNAMVLAAGFGKRMRPLTDTVPKPLIKVGGRPLIDWSLNLLADAGVSNAVVNIHYLGNQIADHLDGRPEPSTTISDERDLILDSAGGIIKALPMLGTRPFFVLNADTFWIDRSRSSLVEMAERWNGDKMDMLMLLADPKDATGHNGTTDFLMNAEGRLSRAQGSSDGYIYAGALILNPVIFQGEKPEPQSLNVFFDRAIKNRRLFGLVLSGSWITVGTPEAIAPAEAAIRAAAAPVQ